MLTLAIVLVSSWLIVVLCVLAMFHVAARGDDAPSASWYADPSTSTEVFWTERVPAADLPLTFERFSRAVYRVRSLER